MLTQVIKALYAGYELSNSETWKNRQKAINAISTVLGLMILVLAKFGMRLELSAEDLATISTAVVTIFGAINVYLTVATSKRVQLLPATSATKSDKPQGVGD